MGECLDLDECLTCHIVSPQITTTKVTKTSKTSVVIEATTANNITHPRLNVRLALLLSEMMSSYCNVHLH